MRSTNKWIQRLQVAAALLLVLSANIFPAECWLGERFGTRVQSYLTKTDTGGLSADQCLAECQKDSGSVLQVCQRLGTTYVNSTEFGCFYKSADNTIELLLRAPLGFYGCTEICECPEGMWYEAFRHQCVEATGTPVPNMPNGDKGGGYHVKDGYLFKDAGRADCRMLPSGEPASGGVYVESMGRWTSWMNIDQPGGDGDIENLKAYIVSGKVCARPIEVQCRTAAGLGWLDTGQVYTCNRSVGGICTNFTQPKGESCLDYEVRFLCP